MWGCVRSFEIFVRKHTFGHPGLAPFSDEPWPNRRWLAVMPTFGPVDLAADRLALKLQDRRRSAGHVDRGRGRVLRADHLDPPPVRKARNGRKVSA
jgi:hypothetical protein